MIAWGVSSTSASRFADQAVEQGRLADVGPADDRDGERHGGASIRTGPAPPDGAGPPRPIDRRSAGHCRSARRACRPPPPPAAPRRRLPGRSGPPVISPVTGSASRPSPVDPTTISRPPASTGPDQMIASCRSSGSSQRGREGDPADAAAVGVQRHQIGFVGDDEGRVARDPRHLDAAQVLLPGAGAAAGIDPGHAAGMADRENQPVGHHRLRPDVGQRGPGHRPGASPPPGCPDQTDSPGFPQPRFSILLCYQIILLHLFALSKK